MGVPVQVFTRRFVAVCLLAARRVISVAWRVDVARLLLFRVGRVAVG